MASWNVNTTSSNYLPEKANSLLPVEFFRRNTELVARELLGKVFVRRHPAFGKVSAIITETEAYLPEGDDACHAATGKSTRNEPMFGSGGILYVYKIYGIHHCANVVTESAGKGCAVLIRAAEPIEGICFMRKNRGIDDIRSLCKGPGNFAKAFGLDTGDNFKSLVSDEVFIENGIETGYENILTTRRIGISKSAEMPLRFLISNSKFVSAHKKPAFL